MLDSERARKNASAILQALAKVGQTHVAEFLSVSESTVSRFKEKAIPEAAELLAACGLKAVPESLTCYKPESIAALLTLAKERVQRLESIRELEWEE